MKEDIGETMYEALLSEQERTALEADLTPEERQELQADILARWPELEAKIVDIVADAIAKQLARRLQRQRVMSGTSS